MPKGQKSTYGRGELHFITIHCFRHYTKLGVEKHRNLFEQLLEEVRHKFRFKILGYALLPAQAMLLISEPERETADEAMQTLKQRYGRRYNVSVRLNEQVFEPRDIDVHAKTADYILAALTQMHQAPVKEKLVENAVDWEWSSARRYAGLPEGTVTLEPWSGLPIAAAPAS